MAEATKKSIAKKAAPAKKTAAKTTAAKKARPAAKPAAKKTVAKKSATVAKKVVSTKSTLKDRILAVIKNGARLAALATVSADGKPCVRIMSMKNDGLNLAAATYTGSKKVAHIESNGQVSISILKDHAKMSDYITISALATVCRDAKTKKAFWNPGLANYFKDADDPNYCVIKFKPLSIEFNDAKTFKTETLKLASE